MINDFTVREDTIQSIRLLCPWIVIPLLFFLWIHTARVIRFLLWLTHRVRKCSRWVPVWPSYEQVETSEAVAHPCGPPGRTEGPRTPAWSSAEAGRANRGRSVAGGNRRFRSRWHGEVACAAGLGLGDQMVGTCLPNLKGTWNWGRYCD